MFLLRLISLILALLITQVNAATPMTPRCVFLGSTPSFIIKLKNNPSNLLQHSELNTAWLARLSATSQLHFMQSRAMAWGAYIVFFTPPIPKQYCYAPDDIKTYLDRIKQDPDVLRVGANVIMQIIQDGAQAPAAAADLGLDPLQWDMDITSLGGIDAVDAWNTTRGDSVMVADLDTGIFDNASLTPNLLTGATFSDNGQTVQVGATASCTIADCGAGVQHGTHTAGTIAASGTYAYGHSIYGVAPNAKVLPINVFTRYTGGGCGATACVGAYTSDILDAVGWLTGTAFPGLPSAPQVVAFNMSFGGGYPCAWDPGEEEVFATAVAANITPVAAAGNADDDTAYFSPASCPSVIAVAATGATHLKAYYSNWGDTVAIAAPGGDAGIDSQIYSTLYQSYAGWQGTSMATPHVTGLMALLYALDPTMTQARALTIIKNTATPFATGTGSRSCAAPTTCGAGIIDAATAVAAVTPTSLNWVPNFQTATLSLTSVQLSWTAATWSNSATTVIKYSVALDGTAVPSCQTMTATTCVLTGLSLSTNSLHSFSVSATDYRAILTPNVQTGTLTTTLIAPTLTSAVRNPNLLSEVWLGYSSVGSDVTDATYIANNLPDDVSVTLDQVNQRFVLENVASQRIADVSLTVHQSTLEPATSNTVIIPSVDFQAPLLTSALRNPTLSSEVWLAYSNLGTDLVENTYTLNGLPDTVTMTLDKTKKYFVLENVAANRITGVSVTVNNSSFDPVTSNQITISSTDFQPPLLTLAVRNPDLESEVWLFYKNLGTDLAGNTYTVTGLANDVTLSLDKDNERFVLENVTPLRTTGVSVMVQHANFDAAISNQVTITGTPFLAPSLTTATRNPTLPTEVWISYSNLGTSLTDNVYLLSGLPNDVTVTLDTTQQRFVLENVDGIAAANVSIIVYNPLFSTVISNPVNIATADFVAPTLKFAARNLALPTEGWIYYNDLGTDYAANTYSLQGFPNGATIILDRANQRFIIKNIMTPKAAQVYIQSTNPALGTVNSATIRFPSIAG